MKTITFESVNPPAFGTDVFGGSTNLKDVYVPSGTTQNYRSVLPSNINIIEKTVSSISMKTLPNKTEYVKGQSLDLSGAVITATYNNGDTVVFPVTSGMISGFDGNKTGIKRVTVSYGGYSTSFEVTVSEKASDPISSGNTSSNPTTSSGGSSSGVDSTVPNPKTGSGSSPIIPFALLGGSAVSGTILVKRRRFLNSKRRIIIFRAS